MKRNNLENTDALCEVKLTVVIICWNDSGVILDCVRSIFEQDTPFSLEVIISDNGSTDGSIDCVRKQFSRVKIIENGLNLGFAEGNNAGFQAARGEYVLILNPDTIAHHGSLKSLVSYADHHPEAGAFGCRVVNSDGSLQHTAQPLPTVVGHVLASLFLRFTGRLCNAFLSDSYPGWDGRTERTIGFQAGCALLIRRALLKALNGFDERFFHQFEDADLCRRVWASGNSVLFCPDAEITHIGGRNRGGYPIAVILETERSKYKYFHKHYGVKGLTRIRCVSLIAFSLRYLACRTLRFVDQRKSFARRLQVYRTMLKWHWQIDPIRFVNLGEEPNIGYAPLDAKKTNLNQKSSAVETLPR